MQLSRRSLRLIIWGLHATGLAVATVLAFLALTYLSYIVLMSPMVYQATNALHATIVVISAVLFTLSLLICPIGAWIALFRGRADKAWRYAGLSAALGAVFVALWLTVSP